MTQAGSLTPLAMGVNHRSGSLSLRDRLFVENAEVRPFLDGLRDAGLDQAIIVSTCDRVEVQAYVTDPTQGQQVIGRALARRAEVDQSTLAGSLYAHQGKAAVRHIFAVAAALDSQVIGEPQVLGQLKAGHKLAKEAGLQAGPLDALLQAAYSVAKRVRAETAIGERPVSIASAAVRVARDLHGDLDRVSGLLVGAGDMGELVAQAMIAAGIDSLSVTHERKSRAETVARVLDCHLSDWALLDEILPLADVVLLAVNGREHVLSADRVDKAIKARRHRPMFIVDLAVPGDVEPAVGQMADAFLYSLDDLERVALDGQIKREQEAQAAWAIIDQEVQDFLTRGAERDAVPTLSDLRTRFEAERARVLEEAGGDAEKATRLLLNRLLHMPSRVLRESAAQGGEKWTGLEAALHQLYGLTQEDED